MTITIPDWMGYAFVAYLVIRCFLTYMDIKSYK